MSMVTRCPACGTGFRVSAGQLKAQRGVVRCGRCAAVFNAFDTLATLEDAPAPSARLPEPAETGAAAPWTAAEAVPVATSAAEDSSGASPEEPAATPELPEERHQATADEPAATEAVPAAEDSAAAPAVPPAAASGPFASGFRLRQGRSGAWAAGSAVLLLVLAVQLAYVFRTEIAGAQPRARPWLEQACARLGCTVPYPRDIQQWSIESSDLQSDPDQPARMILTAVLRNRAAFAQNYPALELTLTDTSDQAVARRVLGAVDYLPPESKAGPGLGPNSEVTLHLAMDTGELNAAGYRLYLFYP